MRHRHGHFTEQRRPELADAERRPAVRQVHVGKAAAEHWLLVPERRGAEWPEEISLERCLRCPLAQHRSGAEVEPDARVPDVAVQEPLVGRGLGNGCPLGVLALAEPVEQPAVVEHCGVDEAADGQGVSRPQLDRLLRAHGRRPPKECRQGDRDYSEPRNTPSHEDPPLLWDWVMERPQPFTAPMVKPWMKRSMKRL